MATDRHRRRHAMRHMLKPDQLKGSMAVAQQPAIRNAALVGGQAGMTAAIALPLFMLSPWADLVGFAALGALVALFGRFAPSRRRHLILLACALCQMSAVFVMSLVVALGASEAVQLGVLAAGCAIFLYITIAGKFGPPGAVIFAFGAAASMGADISFGDVIERTAAAGITAIFAYLVCLATEALRIQPSEERPLPADPELPQRDLLHMGLRGGVASLLAAFISYTFGASHPGWAAMGALAVLQGTHLQINMNRALQRSAGTAFGAIIAWALLMQDPSVWVLIALIVFFQFLTEVVIGANYAFGQALVTPMALLMAHLVSPHTAGAEMVPERVLDTILGTAIGMLVAVLLSTNDDRRKLTG